MKVGSVFILNKPLSLESKSGFKTQFPIYSRFIINKSLDKIELLSISHKNTYFEIDKFFFNKHFSPSKSIFTSPIVKDWEILNITRSDFFNNSVPLDIFKNGKHIATASLTKQNKITIKFSDQVEVIGYKKIVSNLAQLITKTALPNHPQQTVLNSEIYRLINSILILYLLERMNLGAMTIEDYFLNLDFECRKSTPLTKN